VRTVRAECLDWFLILNQQHLEAAVAAFVHHYNTHRPHRRLDLRPPQPTPSAHPSVAGSLERIQRRDCLGGLVHEYVVAA
jgi:hypothetical protein